VTNSRKKKPYIIDVYLCPPDQTYYPLTGHSKYTDLYPARSLDELIRLLESDGWKRCGMLLATDGHTRLQMLGKKPTAAECYLVKERFLDPNEHLIAVAED
jgi:hypothetical protein